MSFLQDVVNRVRNTVSKLPTTPAKQEIVNRQISQDARGNSFLDTLGRGINNWLVAPAAQVPYRMQEATKARQAGKPMDWALNLAQAVGGLIPGIDDAAFAGYNALKNKAAGDSFSKGLSGDEFKGLGDVGRKYGLPEGVANAVNTAELPLMLLGGGLKARSAMKKADQTANVLKNTINKEKLISSLMEDSLARGITPDPDVIKYTSDLIDSGENITEVVRQFNENVGFQPGTGEAVVRNAGKTLDQIKAENNAGIDATLAKAKIKPTKELLTQKPEVTDILNNTYNGPTQPVGTKPKYDIMDRIKNGEPLTDKPVSPKLVVNPDKPWSISDKEISVPYMSKVETIFEGKPVKNTSVAQMLFLKGAEEDALNYNPSLKTNIEKIKNDFTSGKITADEAISNMEKLGKTESAVPMQLPKQEIVSPIRKEFNPDEFIPPELKQPKPSNYNPQTDYVDFHEKMKPVLAQVSTPEQKQGVLSLLHKHVAEIDTRLKAAGMTMEQVADDLRNGVATTPEHIAVQNLFNTAKEYSQATGIKVKDQPNYWFRQTQEKIDKILANNGISSFGDIVSRPVFSLPNKEKLKDWAKGSDVIEAYWSEALKNIGHAPPVQAYIDAAKETAKQFAKGGEADLVSIFKNANRKAGNIGEVIYAINSDAGRKAPGVWRQATQSLLSEATNTDSKFWQEFIYPIKQTEQKTSQMIAEVLKSDGDDAGKIAEIRSIHGQMFKEIGDTFSVLMKQYEPGDEYTHFLMNKIGNTYLGDAQRVVTTADKILKGVRMNVNRSMLGLNVYSGINNAFETTRIASTVSSKSAKTAAKLQAQGVSLLEKYGMTGSSFIQDTAAGKAIAKFDEGLFYLFDRGEKLKNNYALLAYETEGLAKGLSGSALQEFVLKNYDKNALAFGKGNDLMGVNSELMKTLTQYLSFPLRDTGIWADMVKNKETKMVVKRVMFGAAQMGLMGLMTNVMNPGNAFSPLGLVQNVTEGKVGGPVVQGLIKLFAFTSADDKAIGIQSGDYESEKRKRAAIDTTASLLGVPAYNQLVGKTGIQAETNKLLEPVIPGSEKFLDQTFPQGTLMTQKRGFKNTYTGNVAYPAPTNTAEILRSAVFGESGTPEAKAYFKGLNADEQPSLSKTETEAFKQMPKAEQVPFYNKLKARDANRASSEQMLKDFKAGKTPKPGQVMATGDMLKKTKGEVDDEKAAYDAKVNYGMSVTDEEVKQQLFPNPPKNIKTNSKVYTTVNTVFEDPNLSDEYKQQVLKASGLDQEDFEYYQLTNLDDSERKQISVGLAQQEDRTAVVQSLIASKRLVAGKALVTSSEIDYLYDMGLISKDEKALINAQKFDEAKGKFYQDRDYASSGGSGMSPKALVTTAKGLMTSANKPIVIKRTSRILKTPKSTNMILKTKKKVPLKAFTRL